MGLRLHPDTNEKGPCPVIMKSLCSSRMATSVADTREKGLLDEIAPTCNIKSKALGASETQKEHEPHICKEIGRYEGERTTKTS